jgi:hypothetical protein
MATVNFSVPDEVKEAFGRTELFRRLTARRPQRPAVSDREILRARTAGRS